eukprot:9777888-Alexandrium_andersonii.AAC.1
MLTPGAADAHIRNGLPAAANCTAWPMKADAHTRSSFIRCSRGARASTSALSANRIADLPRAAPDG